MLSVYNSSLENVGGHNCKNYSNICGNSKFVFGLWAMDHDDDDDGDNNEQAKPSSKRQRIQVHDVDTLGETFSLRVSKKYRIHRIVADEHHMVAMWRLEGDPFGMFTHWFTSVFDLAICNEIGSGGKKACFSLPERQIDLPPIWLSIADVFLLEGWLVVRGLTELAWLDKEGNRSETSTELVTHKLRKMYASRSVLLLDVRHDMLLIKRF